jgi:FKBP-type peptidyl-prolyl cis-trans isomerase SlyD
MAIKKDQVLVMQYELKVNGDIIESNLDGDPIEVKFMGGQLLDGLEDRMVNMNEGETKEITVPTEEAFGKYDENLMEVVPVSEFEGIDLEIGMILEADGENGETFKATVTEVTDKEVTVDYNHPLADADLVFTVFIKTIV